MRKPKDPQVIPGIAAVRVDVAVGRVTIIRQKDTATKSGEFQACADFGGSRTYGYGSNRARAIDDLAKRGREDGLRPFEVIRIDGPLPDDPKEKMLEMLQRNFPWLGTEKSVDFRDQVAKLAKLYAALGGVNHG